MPSLTVIRRIEEETAALRPWHWTGPSGRIAELADAAALVQTFGEHGVRDLLRTHPEADCWHALAVASGLRHDEGWNGERT